MRWVAFVLIAGLLAWHGYTRHDSRDETHADNRDGEEAVEPAAPPRLSREGPGEPRFQCDGRTHCSHMSSCAEATFFLQNCPGTEMDGDHDGIPCERQWCKWSGSE